MSFLKTPNLFRNIFLTALTAVLLILSFPKTDFWWLAWVSLVPLFIILDDSKPVSSLRWSYLCGILFFSGTLYWIGYVTKSGLILMIMYLSVYFGIFGWCYCRLRKLSVVAQILLVPCVWVFLEFFRARLLSGFSWASLGLTQYQLLPMIQIADITGFYGVSFLIIFVNFFVKEVISSFCIKRKPFSGALYVLSFVLLLGTLGYGFVKMVRGHDVGSIRVTVVQGNIDLATRWKESAWMTIIEKYLDLSRGAPEDTELMIWPETSFPGFLWEDDLFLTEIRQMITGSKIPLLLGAVLKEDDNYYNTAVMLGVDNTVLGVYRKKHLVPYGEYMPFRKYMPFLEDIVPIDDFTSGKDLSLLPVPKQGNKKIAVLICFEDTVSRLVRQFVVNGANIFVNMTNDAWFKDSKGLIMHLQSSVFRSIENRRSMVRVANTGVSAFIDPYGRIKLILGDENGNILNVAAVGTQKIGLREEITFYSRFGDIFALGCLFFGGGAVLFNRRLV